MKSACFENKFRQFYCFEMPIGGVVMDGWMGSVDDETGWWYCSINDNSTGKTECQENFLISLGPILIPYVFVDHLNKFSTEHTKRCF